MSRDNKEFTCILSTHAPCQCCSQAQGLQPGYQDEVQIWLCQDWDGQERIALQGYRGHTPRARLPQQAGWCGS